MKSTITPMLIITLVDIILLPTIVRMYSLVTDLNALVLLCIIGMKKKIIKTKELYLGLLYAEHQGLHWCWVRLLMRLCTQ